MTKRCENELIIIVKEIVADLINYMKTQKIIKNLKIFKILLLVKVI